MQSTEAILSTRHENPMWAQSNLFPHHLPAEANEPQREEAELSLRCQPKVESWWGVSNSFHVTSMRQVAQCETVLYVSTVILIHLALVVRCKSKLTAQRRILLFCTGISVSDKLLVCSMVHIQCTLFIKPAIFIILSLTGHQEILLSAKRIKAVETPSTSNWTHIKCQT